MNGSLARSLEYDDMAMPDIHPSGVIAPVALAIGEWQGVSEQDLLTGFALGLEICLRVGRAGYDAVARTSRFFGARAGFLGDLWCRGRLRGRCEAAGARCRPDR